MLRGAAWAGLQDSAPRAALLSMHARVEGTSSTSWEHPPLVQLWGPRFNDYVVAASDVPIFTLGRLPVHASRRARAQDTAERLHAILNSGRMPFGEAGRAMCVQHNSLRYAAPTGTVLLRWDGVCQPVMWTVPAPGVDPQHARLELARRYLRVFGPATSTSFAKWAGIRPAEASGVFGALAGTLTPVRTPIGDAWIFAKDEAGFRTQPGPAAAARLSPPVGMKYPMRSNDVDWPGRPQNEFTVIGVKGVTPALQLCKRARSENKMDLNIRSAGRLLRVTLCRAAKRNALTAEMCAGIVKAVASSQNSRDIGAILIDADGHVFSSGMDLTEATQRVSVRRLSIHEKLFTLGLNSLKPIVICVAGHAMGGGLGLVAQGHVVIAAEGSLFGLTEIRVGLWPFVVYRSVEAAIGARRTQELALTGRLISSQDALQCGLVHQLSPPAEIAERAEAIANDLAHLSPEAMTLGMQYVRASRGKTWAKAGELANAARAKLLDSPDFAEGVAAFKEKRNPRWPSMPKSFYSESNPESE